MTSGPDGSYRFFVEGSDDFHAILNLLARHELSRETLPQTFPAFRPPKTEDEHEDPQGKEAVLRAIETAVKVNPNESVGFVLDADDDIRARWESGKAVLHAWLAWQNNPGRPYGTAIKSGYLRHDSAAARRFVAWFRQLFVLEGSTA